MNRRIATKSYYYVLLAVLCAIVFGLTRRIDVLFFASPFVAALMIGLPPRNETNVELERTVSRRVAFEGERLVCHIGVRANSNITCVELLEPLPYDAALQFGSNNAALSLAAGKQREIAFGFTIPTRRLMSLSPVGLRTIDLFGFHIREGEAGRVTPIAIHPAVHPLRSMITPENTQVNSGNYRSRNVGEGVEFATVRELTAGDRLSSVNWRVSARRGELYVNDFVVERNSDVMLLVDTFSDVTHSNQVTSLDLSATCASSVAYRYMREKDRVGLIE